MTALLDAHTLLWALFAPSNLSRNVMNLLADSENTFLFSEAGLAELLNKCGRGRLPVAGNSVADLLGDISNFGAAFVPILQADIVTAAGLPHHHSDPFDRFLIAQAKRLAVPVITVDSKFSDYGLQTIW